MYSITKPQTTWQLCKAITRLWVSNVHFMSGLILLEIFGTLVVLIVGRFFMLYALSLNMSLTIVMSYWVIMLCIVAGVAQIHAYYKNIILHRLAAVVDGKTTFAESKNVEIARYTRQRIFWGSLIIAWIPYIISFAVYNMSAYWNEGDSIALYIVLMMLFSCIVLYFYVRLYVWAAIVIEKDETIFEVFGISYRLTRGSFWRLAFTLLLPYVLMITVAITGGIMEVGYLGVFVMLLIMLAISTWYYPAQILILTDLYLREGARREQAMQRRKSS